MKHILDIFAYYVSKKKKKKKEHIFIWISMDNFPRIIRPGNLLFLIPTNCSYFQGIKFTGQLKWTVAINAYDTLACNTYPLTNRINRRSL